MLKDILLAEGLKRTQNDKKHKKFEWLYTEIHSLY